MLSVALLLKVHCSEEFLLYVVNWITLSSMLDELKKVFQRKKGFKAFTKVSKVLKSFFAKIVNDYRW